MVKPALSSSVAAIAPSSNESVATSSDSWLTLKEVAAAIGANYSRLSDSRGEMSEEEFLDYLYQRTLEKRKPQHWEFDRSLGRKGMFRPVPLAGDPGSARS